MTLAADAPLANIDIVRSALAAVGRHDLEASTASLSEDFIINIAGMPGQKRGKRAWRQHAEILYAAFPDIAIAIEDIFAAGDRVAVRARITGSHRGEFLGVQPTGRAISYESNEIYRIANGRIAEEWICSDMLTLMTQIGAISSTRLIMWLAGARVWFALAAGLLAGGGLAALLLG